MQNLGTSWSVMNWNQFKALIPNQKHHLVSNMKSHDCSSEQSSCIANVSALTSDSWRKSKVQVLHRSKCKVCPHHRYDDKIRYLRYVAEEIQNTKLKIQWYELLIAPLQWLYPNAINFTVACARSPLEMTEGCCHLVHALSNYSRPLFRWDSTPATCPQVLVASWHWPD